MSKGQLEQSEGKQGKKSSRGDTLIIAAGAVVGGVLVVLAFLLGPRLIQLANQSAYVDYLDYDDNFPASEEEILYADLMDYCALFIGYGVETCLDWVDWMLRDFSAPVTSCVEQFDLSNDKLVTQFSACLDEAEVPQPSYG